MKSSAEERSRLELITDERTEIVLALRTLAEERRRRAAGCISSALREHLELRALLDEALSYLLSYSPMERRNARRLVAVLRRVKVASWAEAPTGTIALHAGAVSVEASHHVG